MNKFLFKRTYNSEDPVFGKNKNTLGVQLSLLVLFSMIFSLFAYATSYAGHNGYHIDKGHHHGSTGIDHNIFGLKDNKSEEFTGATVASEYKLLLFGGVSLALVALFVVGSGLRGSRGINRKNPYVKGQEYIRTYNQNLVFRSLVVIAAMMVLGSFFTEVFFDIRQANSRAIKGKDGKDLPNRISGDQVSVWKSVEYVFSPSNGYYQCFLSSLFIGMAILTRKYKGLPVMMPLALLGSLRTLIDVKNDGGENACGTSVYFHRFMMIHVAIVIIPLFIVFTNRIRFDLLTLKRTIIYTFIMVFVAYAIMTTGSAGKTESDKFNKYDNPLHAAAATMGTDQDYIVNYDQWGELIGAGVLLGKEADGVNAHIHVYFGFILVPFGIAVIVAFYLISNVSHFAITYKGNMFKEYVASVKGEEGDKLKDSVRLPKRLANLMTKDIKVKLAPKKYTYVPFGRQTTKGILRDATL